MNKEHELKKAKRIALLLLLMATTLFIFTLFLQPNFWISGLKAISEAAMVGVLADWFAVVALFRRIPVPYISRHTAIIPRNKAKIADNLGLFVQEKFLDNQSLIGLIRQHNPLLQAARWLIRPRNSLRSGQQVIRILNGILELADDRQIQRAVKQAVSHLLRSLDLNQSAVIILTSLTKNDRHQALLDNLIRKLIPLLRRSDVRGAIADHIVDWMHRDHPNKARFLPMEWLGEQGAVLMTRAVNALLDDIADDKNHRIRTLFDRWIARTINGLQQDTTIQLNTEKLKAYLLNDDTFNLYISELWEEMRLWLWTDMQRRDSRMKKATMGVGIALGKTLRDDQALRDSLNKHLEHAVEYLAPDVARFLTRHISETINGWDNVELSRQIELNIGKDLQFIRINGTLVGGMIGLGLYLFSQLPAVILPLLALTDK